jgi:hypothetical protein
MAGGSNSSIQAVERLRLAIEGMPERRTPPEGGTRVTLPRMRLTSIGRRVKSLGRNMQLIGEAVAAAEADPLSEMGIRAIEEALWRLDASREQLIAVCCMALGLPAVRLKKLARRDPVPRGVEFDPDPKKLGVRLKALGTQGNAAHLNQLLMELADHRAIRLRNQLSHELAPLTEAPELEWIEVKEMRGRQLVAQTGRFIWPEGMTDRKNIQPKTLWDYSVDAVGDAEAVLVRAIETAAELVQAVGQLEYPQLIYRDAVTGGLRPTP